MHSPSPFLSIDRPAIVRDRNHITLALCRALLALETERANGADSIRHLSVTLARHLSAAGVELRVKRAVRP